MLLVGIGSQDVTKGSPCNTQKPAPLLFETLEKIYSCRPDDLTLGLLGRLLVFASEIQQSVVIHPQSVVIYPHLMRKQGTHFFGVAEKSVK